MVFNHVYHVIMDSIINKSNENQYIKMDNNKGEATKVNSIEL